MRIFNSTIYTFFLLLLFPTLIYAGPGPKWKSKKKRATLRSDCKLATQQVDQEINNVRARLLNGGDMWWNGTDGRYVVPKIAPGSSEPERSSIYAGAIWMGGLDDADNLKLAAQTYGRARGNTDYWPGPLSDIEGTIDSIACRDWDRFFKVLGKDIEQHIANYYEAKENNISYDPVLIPEEIKNWPARGNPYFFETYKFNLPNTGEGLAPFFDQNGNGLYEPALGDYPVLQLGQCNSPDYADEMIFWIYNDAGGVHTESNGDAIRMEIQAMSFAYQTNDEFNNMTFQNHRLINRAVASIDSTYFSLWIDPDLGCGVDDYVGCDPEADLMYVYNEDQTDGFLGCECDGGVNTYCNDVPILGIDFLQGAKNEFGEQLGMTAFTYHNRGDLGWNGTSDPSSAMGFYNYMAGYWNDGTPLTRGGDGYDPTSTDITKFAFPNAPDDLSGWSMCTANLPFGDRKTNQSTGPFRLDPGATNNIAFGVIWIPQADYPCPDISYLLTVDKKMQDFFDDCAYVIKGPDAPNVDWIEMNNKVIAVLTNEDRITNNNRNESFEELDGLAPDNFLEEARKYKFEGYKIYQLLNADVRRNEYDNPDKARVVESVDIKNGIKEIYNWVAIPNQNSDPLAARFIYTPELKTALNQDEGIRHTFEITEDQFAEGDRTLINHKQYYFSVVAYAHNEYQEFFVDGKIPTGQQNPYLEGLRNVKIYTVIPRPIVDVNLNAEYGDAPAITRVDGVGAGGRFLDVTAETREAMLSDDFDERITYQAGQAPIEVKVYNPLEVVDGTYQLKFVDNDLNDDQLDSTAGWNLINTNSQLTIASAQTIAKLNEQIIPEFGIAVSLTQTMDAGDTLGTGGAIGTEVEYLDEFASQWLDFLADGSGTGQVGINNFVRTELGEVDFSKDRFQELSNVGEGTFYPYLLTIADPDLEPYISPAWQSNTNIRVKNNGELSGLNNVDIVFTNDKSKWSRCVIVETATNQWTDRRIGAETIDDTEQFELRSALSVGKEDTDGDGLPDLDGAVNVDGDPLIGFGWFPGYAVDVESGERLNIFFGENSTYSAKNISIAGGPNAYTKSSISGKYPGEDMMFNPSSQLRLNTTNQNIYNLYAGGHHFIYLTNERYDECREIAKDLSSSRSLTKAKAISKITWTGIPLLAQNASMLPYREGLIPNDVVVKIRIDNPFQVKQGTGNNNGHPAYEFTLEGFEKESLVSRIEIDEQLDAINVVPNPYYGYSNYEISPVNNVVKITNLPAQCQVTIYSLDGQFVQSFSRNERVVDLSGRTNRGIRTGQINPDLIWDLKNNEGNQIAGGTYLIHIDAGNLGERVIKWFGIRRQFDPSDL